MRPCLETVLILLVVDKRPVDFIESQRQGINSRPVTNRNASVFIGRSMSLKHHFSLGRGNFTIQFFIKAEKMFLQPQGFVTTNNCTRKIISRNSLGNRTSDQRRSLPRICRRKLKTFL